MTEQEKQEIIEEIKKSLAEEKYAHKTDGTQTVLRKTRDAWFRDENHSGHYSIMTSAFDMPGISWRVWCCSSN